MPINNPVIVLLSSWNAPELPDFIHALQEHSIPISGIVFSGECDAASIEIVASRTNGFFQPKSWFEVSAPSVPCYFVKNHNSPECIEIVRGLGCHLLLNAGTPHILKTEILEAPKVGIVNCHPGLLPKYRGCTCVEWSLYFDDPVGATCHFMTTGIDDGPIISLHQMRIPDEPSYEKIRGAMVYHVCESLAKGVLKVISEDLSPEGLPPQASGSYHKPIPSDKLEAVRAKCLSLQTS